MQKIKGHTGLYDKIRMMKSCLIQFRSGVFSILNSYPIFQQCIARKINPIIPVNARTIFIHLNILNQMWLGFKHLEVFYSVNILSDIINNAFSAFEIYYQLKILFDFYIFSILGILRIYDHSINLVISGTPVTPFIIHFKISRYKYSSWKIG